MEIEHYNLAIVIRCASIFLVVTMFLHFSFLFLSYFDFAVKFSPGMMGDCPWLLNYQRRILHHVLRAQHEYTWKYTWIIMDDVTIV